MSISLEQTDKRYIYIYIYLPCFDQESWTSTPSTTAPAVSCLGHVEARNLSTKQKTSRGKGSSDGEKPYIAREPLAPRWKCFGPSNVNS